MNSLQEKYNEMKGVLKERGNKDFGKNEFFSCVYSKIPQSVFEDILNENTPKEYFVLEAMARNDEVKDKLFKMIEGCER